MWCVELESWIALSLNGCCRQSLKPAKGRHPWRTMAWTIWTLAAGFNLPVAPLAEQQNDSDGLPWPESLGSLGWG